MLFRSSIYEGQQLTPRRGIDHLIYPRQRKWILGTRLVQIGEVNADAPHLDDSRFIFFLLDQDQIGNLVWVQDLHDEPGCEELGQFIQYSFPPVI